MEYDIIYPRWPREFSILLQNLPFYDPMKFEADVTVDFSLTLKSLFANFDVFCDADFTMGSTIKRTPLEATVAVDAQISPSARKVMEFASGVTPDIDIEAVIIILRKFYELVDFTLGDFENMTLGDMFYTERR